MKAQHIPSNIDLTRHRDFSVVKESKEGVSRFLDAPDISSGAPWKKNSDIRYIRIQKNIQHLKNIINKYPKDSPIKTPLLSIVDVIKTVRDYEFGFVLTTTKATFINGTNTTTLYDDVYDDIQDALKISIGTYIIQIIIGYDLTLDNTTDIIRMVEILEDGYEDNTNVTRILQPQFYGVYDTKNFSIINDNSSTAIHTNDFEFTTSYSSNSYKSYKTVRFASPIDIISKILSLNVFGESDAKSKMFSRSKIKKLPKCSHCERNIAFPDKYNINDACEFHRSILLRSKKELNINHNKELIDSMNSPHRTRRYRRLRSSGDDIFPYDFDANDSNFLGDGKTKHKVVSERIQSQNFKRVSNFLTIDDDDMDTDETEIGFNLALVDGIRQAWLSIQEARQVSITLD